MNTITPIITSTAITAKDTVGTATAAATVDTDEGYLSTPTWYVRFCPIMTCKFCDVDSCLPQEWMSSFTYQHWCFKNAIWSFLRRQAKQLQDCRKIKYYNSSILLEFRNFTCSGLGCASILHGSPPTNTLISLRCTESKFVPWSILYNCRQSVVMLVLWIADWGEPG